jgi:hypothetical protein
MLVMEGVIQLPAARLALRPRIDDRADDQDGIRSLFERRALHFEG